MKIVRYKYKEIIQTGVIIEESKIISIDNLEIDSKIELDNHEKYILKNKLYNVEPIFLIKLFNKKVITNDSNYQKNKLIKLNEVELLNPIVKPNSLRDAYAFRQHVEAGRKGRGLPMIEEFDLSPVYYYSNHSSITGPGNLFFKRCRSCSSNANI